MAHHFDALYRPAEGCLCANPVAFVDPRCPKHGAHEYHGKPAPAAHPCNVCGGVDLPIVNDAGVCSACAEEG